ncbi:pyridoxamine 5'-phosphate oxidase family protein [Meridianimarinicoccus aquatilis]|uniref:Pyridoxamine 5'-phosphate oxidase n=1 Tax=Meridianimarinicoccus aquatilis TaxID=2552766 RepID=A0A4R6B425_9RHOB|nr:pyridoxamine 5'-phosphate oxidase family protein [Fluviibacterium aquatile]TDL91125.1 pyridoxamine 5'-phosphate oxidase [Fluviibacterium aquatile]
MSEWWTDLETLRTRVWETISDGVHNRHSAARVAALATAGQNGGAEARMVVLRGADQTSGKIYVHTDTLSAKVAELRADPRATVLIWDPAAQFQIRLKVEVGIDTGSCVERDWDRIPGQARRVYGNAPEPGWGLECPEALTVTPDQSRFAVMTCTLREIDALHLGHEVHHRAAFRRRDGWRGEWIAP